MKNLLVLITLILMLGCTTQRPIKKRSNFKTRQQKIIECYRTIKNMGAPDKFAGEFCKEIFGDE